ncbi:MAG: NAD-dependent DNA ligase LigA, partial [Bacteroidetes bacterium]|nr:NAD-dependent DNA ligase LigA [Bacteroidota bacterium]
ETEIEAIHEIGSSISQSVSRFFSDEHNKKIIERLKKAGLKFEVEKKHKRSNTLEGKSFVLTGTLSTMSRDEAKEKVIENGGTVLSAVSKNTSYVVAGEKPGSKFDKAQKLNVPVISEEEFLKMIE